MPTHDARWCRGRYVACTKRNKDTLALFLQRIKTNGLLATPTPMPREDVFVWDKYAAVELYAVQQPLAA